ncbi:hypothetical protein D3C84_1154350 [compost metagenome]
MASSATSGTAREIEFMVFQTNQANERSVVKLIATPGKSCPMGVRSFAAMRYRGAKLDLTVQTSKTEQRQ